jgi:hypothetical protein
MRYWMALILFLTLAEIGSAETRVVSFSDPVGCPPCRRLEQVWSSKPIADQMRRLSRRRSYVDVRTASPELLQKWQVDAWPATFLVEVDENNKLVKIYKRQNGGMSVEELSRFLEP